ncbi:MAG: hypothetical protein IH851_03870 [Armatimonadetes bacterium]|nr:hypothetical protein [Armatimonadota bacterium]
MALSWPNAVYPYVQNWAIYSCDKPRKKRLNADYEQPRRGPVTVSYTYNGLLHAFPHSEIAYPGELPVIWEGLGDVAVLGFATTQPTLICDIPGLPCRFQSVAGPHSILSVPLGTMYIHSKGTNMAHADTHAKWRRVGAVISPKSAGPPFTEWDFDPFTGYDEGGNPGWYWAYGIHPWLFRPDNTFDPADYPTPGDVRPRPLFPFKDPD